MVTAFVMVKTSPMNEHAVYAALLKMTEISEVNPLFGEYDLIAKVEAKDYDALGRLVIEKIRSVMGVIDTRTLTGIKF